MFLRLLRLQFRQQLLNLIFLLQRSEPVLDIIRSDLGFRLTERGGMRNLALHAIKRAGTGSIADSNLGITRFAHSASATMLRNQEVRFALGLSELTLQLS